jgi:hypothetical protein
MIADHRGAPAGVVWGGDGADLFLANSLLLFLKSKINRLLSSLPSQDGQGQSPASLDLRLVFLEAPRHVEGLQNSETLPVT